MKCFEIYKEQGRTHYKLFGVTLFKTGKKTGFYDMYSILNILTGVDFKVDAIRVQHGWYADGPVACDLNNSRMKEMFIWSKRLHDDWVAMNPTPCHIAGSPFARYRRHMGITQNFDAKGTIVYPSHSIASQKALYDIDDYCAKLNALPEHFKPFTVCLHPHDVRKYGMDKEYEKRGFKTVCAGLDRTRPFYEVFYDLLKAHKYSTSNEPGSYLLYAVEMGIPFFMLGEQSVLETSGFKKDDEPYSVMARDLFENKPKDEISPEQRDFVLAELGLNDCISTEEMAEILKKYPN